MLGGDTNGVKGNKNINCTYESELNHLNPQYWDIDCDCNLLNDFTDDYSFQEDRGTLKK
ncbi:hypothetical protein [Clostridium sp.]|uniref:hypothetical protein n=1 Tax=Clostridium sp. TaxID=1506 RepID=UPI0025BC5BF2|nr:hypothetical protein [Clostridium sp.]MCI9069483.1 hypothetical protein [Clostridium sp.]